MALTQIIGSGIGQVTDIKIGGSGSANTLDDYEEGTFDLTVSDATSGGNTGSVTQSNKYTKIGDTVILQLNLINYRP